MDEKASLAQTLRASEVALEAARQDYGGKVDDETQEKFVLKRAEKYRQFLLGTEKPTGD